MEDLIQCFSARKDFQRWLELGKTPLREKTAYTEFYGVLFLTLFRCFAHYSLEFS